MHEEISPEAYRAQRMAELKDIAEYRARHLKQIQKWSSDPEHRAKMIAEVEKGAAEARAKVAAECEEYAAKFDLWDRKQLGAIKEVKTYRKLPWWKRLVWRLLRRDARG